MYFCKSWRYIPSIWVCIAYRVVADVVVQMAVCRVTQTIFKELPLLCPHTRRLSSKKNTKKARAPPPLKPLLLFFCIFCFAKSINSSSDFSIKLKKFATEARKRFPPRIGTPSLEGSGHHPWEDAERSRSTSKFQRSAPYKMMLYSGFHSNLIGSAQMFLILLSLKNL